MKISVTNSFAALLLVLPHTIAIKKETDDESRKVRAPTAMELNNINHRTLGKAKGKKKNQQCEMKLEEANEQIDDMKVEYTNMKMSMQARIDELEAKLDRQVSEDSSSGESF